MALNFERNISLASFNTLGIKAQARCLFRLTKLDLLTPLKSHEELTYSKPLYLGGGSNIVLSDGTLASLIIKNELKGIRQLAHDRDSILIEVAAGEIWHDFVQFALANGWYGLENLSLIPGTVGAAPIQNIGAYGVEISQYIDSVVYADLTDHKSKLQMLSAAECMFDYRHSVFKSEDSSRWLIVAVRFRLLTTPTTQTQYGAIENQLAKMGILADLVTPQQVANAVISLRQATLPDPTEQGNVGSFFKNPVVNNQQAVKLLAQYPQLPTYPTKNGLVKLSAGWLIDQAGLKGYRIGDVAVHNKHALVLVNLGNASGTEVRQLAQYIQHAIQERYGLALAIEPTLIPNTFSSSQLN